MIRWREVPQIDTMPTNNRHTRPAKRWNTKNEILLNAVIKGQQSTVKRLVERSFTDVNSKNPHGMSCLQLAIIHGHYKLAEYLIRQGIDVHSADQDGWTALHDAALCKTKSVSRTLLSKGCSITQANNMGELPIDVAGSAEVERFLCEQMVVRGERQLARQYYVYLGLECLGDGTNFELDGSQFVGREHAAPNSSNSKASRGQSTPGGNDRGLSSVGQNTHERLRNSRNEAPDAEVQSLGLKLITDCPQPPYEYTISCVRICEAASINSPRAPYTPQLIRRDFGYGASLCISKDDLVATATVREDCFDELSPLPVTRHRDVASFAPPKRKVSFATDLDEAMARTKLSHSYSGPVIVEKAILEGPATSGVNGAGGLSVEEVARLNGLYKQRCYANKPVSSSDSDGSTFDPEEAISKLKMRPRKSSIATPDRRRHSEPGKRRSVSFQPEVLLQDIVTDGDAKEVRQVLQSGIIPDVNKMTPAGLTALHQSAIDGNLDCAKTLVRNGADVNSVDCEQWTPLHAASMTGHTSLVQFLLNAGANPSLKNEEGDTAYDVAKTGAIRKLLLCAMNGKNPDGDDFSEGEYSGEEEEVYSHAESESDSDSEEGETASSPLFGSSKPTLKERLGLNHSSALKSSRGNSASPSPDLDQLDNVFTSSSDPVISAPRKERELSDSTSSYGSLFEHESERIGHVSEHRHRSHLRPTESDTDKVSEDQGISTMEGSSDCSHRGRTLSDDEGTSRDVLDSELVPGSLDYKFQEAILYCNVDCVLKLVKHRRDIDVNRVNKNSGITALHHAVLEENFALVQHLVKDFEASLSIKDVDGWTPLHAASAVGNICIAQYLLDNGAKPSVLNSQCEFPVDVAEDEAMEKLLKNAMLGPGVGKIFKGIFT